MESTWQLTPTETEGGVVSPRGHSEPEGRKGCWTAGAELPTTLPLARKGSSSERRPRVTPVRESGQLHEGGGLWPAARERAGVLQQQVETGVS